LTSLLSPEETKAAINPINKKKPTIEASSTPTIVASTDFKNDFIGQLYFCKYKGYSAYFMVKINLTNETN
jgi:hypothetical protein